MQGKDLDLSIVISPNEIFEPIRRNLHFISVAKLLRLSIYTYIGSAKLHFHVFFMKAQETLYMYTCHDLRFETLS